VRALLASVVAARPAEGVARRGVVVVHLNWHWLGRFLCRREPQGALGDATGLPAVVWDRVMTFVHIQPVPVLPV
jgi:hypothetical protein